jgi:hypothetical protein
LDGFPATTAKGDASLSITKPSPMTVEAGISHFNKKIGDEFVNNNYRRKQYFDHSVSHFKPKMPLKNISTNHNLAFEIRILLGSSKCFL